MCLHPGGRTPLNRFKRPLTSLVAGIVAGSAVTVAQQFGTVPMILKGEVYEAAADAILYEMDRDYRKKVTLQRKESETTFGASLRRLRMQRKLRRTDFAPLSAKAAERWR